MVNSAIHYLETRTCTQKCKSQKHAEELIAVLTQTADTSVLLSALQQCWNCARIHDSSRRHLIHVAASCGRLDVIGWLIKYKNADLNVKTLENGWNPAHCASFYGQIGALVTLIKLGCNINVSDDDKMTVVESLAVDKWKAIENESFLNEDCDLYTWGSNSNFTLGQNNETERISADVVDFFKKNNLIIKQVVMSKFHTLFRDDHGCVYSCGYGNGGRLGHGDSEICILPKKIESLSNEKCIHVAASKNNSYFLLETGVIKSCGTNELRQLCQPQQDEKFVCPAPKLINMKNLKITRFKQIECGSFHCALVSTNNEVWTFGLNAGQLGHLKEIKLTYSNSFIEEPRIVKELVKNQSQISSVTCSDGTTICHDMTNKQIIYLFYDYKCRRLNLGENISKIRVYGGKLDQEVIQKMDKIDRKEHNHQMKIVCLTESGRLKILKDYNEASSTQPWKLVKWTSSNKQLKIRDFDLSKSNVIISTVEGLCYILNINETKKADVPGRHEVVDMTQVPLINRCLSVTTDRNGLNFAALQYSINKFMKYYPTQEKSILKDEFYAYFTEISQADFHFNVNGRSFPCNKYILYSRCQKFCEKYNLLNESKFQINDKLPKIVPFMLETLMYYVYSNKCNLKCLSNSLKQAQFTTKTKFIEFLTCMKDLFIFFGMDDYKSVYMSLINTYSNMSKNAQIGVEDLLKSIESVSNHQGIKRLRFYRRNHPELYDCVIKCNNNVEIKCHKCVLVARSDYFRNMFYGYWLESSLSEIQLHFDSDLMTIFIDYLYQDDLVYEYQYEQSKSAKTKLDKELELLFNLYVLSDQLLTPRIKNLCEVKLANLVSAKNCVEILQFASDYDAKQLKEYSYEFICNNLITFIEQRSLECIDLTLLNELSQFYCTYYSHINSRRITPYRAYIDLNSIEIIPDHLLYDQKFIDGNYESVNTGADRGDDDSPTSKGSKKSLFRSESVAKACPIDASPSQVSNSILASESKSRQNIDDDEQKWEKVKKKNQRRISEKDVSNQMDKKRSTSDFSITNPSPQKLVVGAFFTENDLKKYEEDKKAQQKQREEERARTAKQSSPTKPIDVQPIKAITASSGPVWGVMPAPRATTHTLLDVMNEEFNKLGINKPQSLISKQDMSSTLASVSTSPKGWNNLNTTSSKTVSPSMPLSQILEIEKNSKEHYKKIVNRNMDSILLEEKAIQDLRKLYNADDSRDMRIFIELVYDTDVKLASYTPIWRK